MSSYNDIYKEVKDILKKLYKKDCFSMFSAKDLFYLMDEKTRGILLFSDHMYQDGHGIQMFLNNTGLNYLHDLLSEEDPAPATYFYSDCHFLAFVPRKDLLPDDIKFFKDNKIRIYEDNNLLPIRFKEGYGKTIMSKKDLSDSLNYLFYTYALISNEKEDLSLAFERDLTPIAIFDNQAMSYTCHYTGLPNLEQMPKNKKVNYNLVDDLKDKEFVDDVCYIFHSYFPVKNTNESAYKTIVLAYYVKRKVYKMELFDCCPEKIEGDPIACYLGNLSENAIFQTNRHGNSKIVKYAEKDKNAIVVITSMPSGVKSFALAKITLNASSSHNHLK